MTFSNQVKNSKNDVSIEYEYTPSSSFINSFDHTSSVQNENIILHLNEDDNMSKMY